MVKVADCHQIALYDPKNNAIGLLHVGWRGLETGIIKKAFNSLKVNFGTDTKNIVVELGPSICPNCYSRDIWTEAENQLKDAGILEKNIYNPRICTYHSGEYYSHKKFSDGKQNNDFRFITLFGMRK
jgi:copper oxidase (laccase) domain-containing protein